MHYKERKGEKKQVSIFSCRSQDALFSLPSHIPQLVLSQTLYLPEAWER